MRVNNDLVCDLAALVEFDDAALSLQSGGSAPTGELKGRFLRHTFIPGLSVAHPAILYDNSSDLYWMVSNLNRDALRSWNTKHPRVRWNPFTFCESECVLRRLLHCGNTCWKLLLRLRRAPWLYLPLKFFFSTTFLLCFSPLTS
jgi:hypothetical protein